MPKKKSKKKLAVKKPAAKAKSPRSATSSRRKVPAEALPLDVAAVQADFRDSYDYAAAGLIHAGVIHPLFTSVRGFAFVDALYRRLLLATDAVIGARTYKDVFHSGDVDWDLWNALAVRGCVRLAEQARAADRQHDEIGLLFRAAVLWCLSPDEIREKYKQHMEKLRKKAGFKKTDKKAHLTQFLRDFLTERKRTPGAVSDDDIVVRMSAPVSGTKKNRHGASLEQLRKYLAAYQKNGQIPGELG
jgi:hypothetical protein